MFYYYQQQAGEHRWEPVPASHRDKLETESHPVFITALAVSKLVENLDHAEKLKLAYAGPLYCDWDSEDEELVIVKVNEFLDKLEDLDVDLEMCRLYATGGRGYHLEVPQELMIDKIPKNGMIGLPMIYREIALELATDTLDLTIYSSGRGRMWRTPNVKRTNGRYKVPITVQEMREMTPELCHQLTSAKRALWALKPPVFCVKLSIIASTAIQKVEDLLKKRAKIKPDPMAAAKAGGYSVQLMMAGLGIKEGTGFQVIATQLAIAAVASGKKEDEFIAECQGLITTHKGDGNRYGSDAKRTEELRRMHRYMNGNACYEFSVGAMKSIMSHSAPDLDGIAATKEDVEQVIKEAAEEDDQIQDEYDDVAKGVTLAKYGVYMDTENGKKRICAISFANPSILRSAENSQIVGYDADVTVNGVHAGRCTLEIDLFSGLVPFNRFVSKYGHAFQGTDAQVRTVMMRFVESAKKKGNVSYVVNREGLDIISIPLHENSELHKPFMVWADSHGVIVEPWVRDTGLVLKFNGHPDPRGVFRSDIAKAPPLAEWIEVPGNRELMKETLTNLMTCQRAEVLGKLLGWYTSCFYKQLFHKYYGKFPLLHINGPAGLGKTEMQIAISSLFYWMDESRPLSPGSSNFAINQHLQAASSIPLILDEYKPHEMIKARHDQFKAMFRDAYNQRTVTRGGGTRESDDFRTLQFTEMAAPMVFIAEASEEEAAVMERVVLVTLARPGQAAGLKNLARFQKFRRNKNLLGILGQYLAAQIINEATKDSFTKEFDALYAEAQHTYMLNEEDLKGDLSSEALQDKQNAKERPVYNHTVAKFGFRQFRKLLNSMFDKELDPLLAELEDGIFDRLTDMHAATTPEYLKVLKEISSMSYHVEDDQPAAIRRGKEYAIVDGGESGFLEIQIHSAYSKYRVYCRNSAMAPLFGGAEPFVHAIKDSPAYVKHGSGEVLQMPRTYIFDIAKLAQLGVDAFK